MLDKEEFYSVKSDVSDEEGLTLPPGVFQREDGSFEITLSKAISVHGEETSKIVMNKPSTGWWRKIKGNIATDGFDMAGQMLTYGCNIPPSSVNQIDPKDFNSKAFPLFWHFFGGSQ